MSVYSEDECIEHIQSAGVSRERAEELWSEYMGPDSPLAYPNAIYAKELARARAVREIGAS